MLLVTSSPFSFSSDGLDASSLIHFASKANKTEEKFICFANHEGQTGAADALFMGLAKVSLINCCHDNSILVAARTGMGLSCSAYDKLWARWGSIHYCYYCSLTFTRSWISPITYKSSGVCMNKGGTRQVNYDGTICLFFVANQLKFMTNWSFSLTF